MSLNPAKSPRFNTTQWSLVLAAGHKSSPSADAALAELYQRYWFPVYAYVRRRVGDSHLAEDLTQEFLCRLNEKNVWAAADPERGRFRSFLLTAARNFLASQWKREGAQKRGGRIAPLSLDFASGESRLSMHPADTNTPEAEFDRRWAVTLLEHVLRKLEAESNEAGKGQQFHVLKQFLAGRTAEMSLTEAAGGLGMTADAVKTAAHRLRRRYRELLREEIAHTVASPEEVDEEIRSLFAALGRA
jgi:RNA polymerase sigma-70 factor (ECF subfamily)